MRHIDLEIIFWGDLHKYDLENSLKYKLTDELDQLKSNFEYYIIY